MMNGKFSSRSVERIGLRNMNLAGTRNAPDFQNVVRIKPRRFHKKFKTRCPHSKCPNVPLIWRCAHCGNELEYFEEENKVVYFSCFCGDRRITDFYGRCSHKDHPETKMRFKGDMEIEPQDNQREQRTIVLVGDTGVGKSTTINNLITTVSYKTWNRAKSEDCVNVAPLWKFVRNSTTGKIERRQLTGPHMENERGNHGESATLKPITYSFTYNKNGKNDSLYLNITFFSRKRILNDDIGYSR